LWVYWTCKYQYYCYINAGSTFTTYGYVTTRAADCGQGSCEIETITVTLVEQIIETGLVNCNLTTTTTTTVGLNCTIYRFQNGGSSDIYNYITCSGTFVNNFLGGFEFVEVCAQTNSANADSIITITYRLLLIHKRCQKNNNNKINYSK
jgi:hypothetical protein